MPEKGWPRYAIEYSDRATPHVWHTLGIWHALRPVHHTSMLQDQCFELFCDASRWIGSYILAGSTRYNQVTDEDDDSNAITMGNAEQFRSGSRCRKLVAVVRSKYLLISYSW
ncbi:unnamed protein product [Amoebophrya sp. A120]|nr:unnamed protein product [Amoebophrya sp. A120]|eukprot:GSA120T00015307001.1